jgi:hypothetical protein
MSTNSLIGKLQAELLPVGESDERYGWNMALHRAIAIICQHEAEKASEPQSIWVSVADIDVEVAIAEAIAVMDSKTDYCETGVPVLKYLKHHGWVVMQSKRDADAIAEALNTIENR